MMVNRHRGEISAMLDGREWTLCLTLGALAELEASFGAEDLAVLLKRFSENPLSAGDILKIVAAGLQGGGNDVALSDVAKMRADGGVTGFAQIVSELLSATFGESKPEPAAISR
ncbi:gene transfer agent family protein [Phyllobacterium sp. SB3]|uniref:gene transfer agent family protein n=1 Tax=Phyllobacterium sp. SB3 TaxID=3156073 RepID=UPI0032AF8D35